MPRWETGGAFFYMGITACSVLQLAGFRLSFNRAATMLGQF